MPLPLGHDAARPGSDATATNGDTELRRVLRALADEPRITTAMRIAEELRAVAAVSPDPADVARELARVVVEGDDLSALAAVHALGSVADPLVDEVLVALVVDGAEPFAAHAAWALGARRSSPAAVEALERLVADGGFGAMLAERTLAEWGRRTVSSVDPSRLAHPSRGSRTGPGPVPAASEGIVVVQPFLHARLDRTGSSLGSGDAGGIASLLRSLGTSLARLDGIAEVVTVTRRHEGEAEQVELAPGHRVVRVDVGGTGPLPWREAWAHRLQIEQQLVELGRSFAGRRVVWHLRMADVGTLAAAAAARRLGQPVVFTAAPDPHIVIDAQQDDGRLDRRRFGVEDAAAQYWFRARMVERLTAQADHLVVLPRPTIVSELVSLLGLHPGEIADRVTVVAEGVDVAEIDRARTRRRHGGVAPAVIRVLESLPPSRRHLPWVLTVGRLHPTKGPQRVVEAVATTELRDRVNVIIVGGRLRDPSADEQSTIELVRRAASGADPSLVTLTGNLPPSDVADLLVEVAERGGAYVGAADKEEFGLAIVEALAAGAVVVAPERGGPRSYVDHGDTGVLCDTLDTGALTAAVQRALELANADDRDARAERARGKVRRDLDIDTMARGLADVYGRVVPVVAEPVVEAA